MGQNYRFLVLVAVVLGFVAGLFVGAYVFIPMGGWGSVVGLASPVIGMVLGPRILFMIMAR